MKRIRSSEKERDLPSVFNNLPEEVSGVLICCVVSSIDNTEV